MSRVSEIERVAIERYGAGKVCVHSCGQRSTLIVGQGPAIHAFDFADDMVPRGEYVSFRLDEESSPEYVFVNTPPKQRPAIGGLLK